MRARRPSQHTAAPSAPIDTIAALLPRRDLADRASHRPSSTAVADQARSFITIWFDDGGARRERCFERGAAGIDDDVGDAIVKPRDQPGVERCRRS